MLRQLHILFSLFYLFNILIPEDRIKPGVNKAAGLNENTSIKILV
jgi:hypothetical protein